jgi:hypothetical protein
MLGTGPVVVGEPEQPAAPAVIAAQQSTIPKRRRLIFIVITRSSPSLCAPARVPVGSTCDVEYQAEAKATSIWKFTCLPFNRSPCSHSRLYLPSRGFRQSISRRMVGHSESSDPICPGGKVPTLISRVTGEVPKKHLLLPHLRAQGPAPLFQRVAGPLAQGFLSLLSSTVGTP